VGQGTKVAERGPARHSAPFCFRHAVGTTALNANLEADERQIWDRAAAYYDDEIAPGRPYVEGTATDRLTAIKQAISAVK
jgi:hypothetical protein